MALGRLGIGLIGKVVKRLASKKAAKIAGVEEAARAGGKKGAKEEAEREARLAAIKKSQDAAKKRAKKAKEKKSEEFRRTTYKMSESDKRWVEIARRRRGISDKQKDKAENLWMKRKRINKKAYEARDRIDIHTGGRKNRYTGPEGWANKALGRELDKLKGGR